MPEKNLLCVTVQLTHTHTHTLIFQAYIILLDNYVPSKLVNIFCAGIYLITFQSLRYSGGDLLDMWLYRTTGEISENQALTHSLMSYVLCFISTLAIKLAQGDSKQ